MDFVTILFGVAVVIFLIWLSNSVYVIKEWERGVVLRLGRMLPEAKGAGLQLVFFPIDKLTRISLRIETLDVPPQDVITRDNVSVKVNAVCYFRVVDANLALSQVQNYLYATSQLAQTTLPRQAETERERRAKVIAAEGEFQASAKLSEAAAVLQKEPTAIQLRYLQTLVEIGVEKNTTVIFPLPVDVISQWMKSLEKK